MSYSDLIWPVAAGLSMTLAATNGAGVFIASRTAADAAQFLTVSSVQVQDARQGEPVVMDVDRRIHQPFLADWVVTVRTVTPEGLTQHCVATSAPRDYTPAAVLPKPLTLDWWTDGQCEPLPVGQHMLSTTWTIRAGRDLPVSVLSNVFEVTE